MDRKRAALPMIIGIGGGAAIGIATGNSSIWIGLGVAFGVVLGLIMNRKSGPDC